MISSRTFALFSLLSRVRVCSNFVGFWFGLRGKGLSTPNLWPCLDVRWFSDLSVSLASNPSWAVKFVDESELRWPDRTVIDRGPPAHPGLYRGGVGRAENYQIYKDQFYQNNPDIDRDDL